MEGEKEEGVRLVRKEDVGLWQGRRLLGGHKAVDVVLCVPFSILAVPRSSALGDSRWSWCRSVRRCLDVPRLWKGVCSVVVSHRLMGVGSAGVVSAHYCYPSCLNCYFYFIFIYFPLGKKSKKRQKVASG